ncbi:MAG: 50S ribosomal protein L44e [Candidatus Thorarchaeota archaeon]|nr:MAG: 50S ribosomal protein L44e [Candidatus Thorarchaeota archaeon]RLI59696.1 MAG: 50S ribosomal protein L44e [Candidatus Thorarchaeota archaeon]
MKMKSELNKYCPRCKKHTPHAVSIGKAGKRRSMSEGERRMDRKKKGYGSFPKAIQKRFAKTTKKTVLRLKCKECDHIIQSKSMRLKKVEVQRA